MHKPDDLEREWLSAAEVCDVTGWSRRHLLRLIQRGTFADDDLRKFPGRIGWKIDRRSLDAYMQGHRVKIAGTRELRNG